MSYPIWREFQCIASITVQTCGDLDEASERKRAELLLENLKIELCSAVPTKVIKWRIGVVHRVGAK